MELFHDYHDIEFKYEGKIIRIGCYQKSKYYFKIQGEDLPEIICSDLTELSNIEIGDRKLIQILDDAQITDVY